MKKIVLSAAALLLIATVAGAAEGQWSLQYNLPGNYNNTFLGVATTDASHLFLVGLWTNGVSEFKFIWRSYNGGASITNIYSWEMSADPAKICEMLHVSDARTSVAATSATNGVFGGSGVDQSCIDKYGPSIQEQFACMIACASTIGPTIWYTEDSGDTFHNAAIPAQNEASVQSLQMLNENVGFAAGLNSYAIKTTDGGKTWTSLAAGLPSSTLSINNVFFVNENTGWLAAGDWDPSSKDAAPQGLALAQRQQHRMMLGVNPQYRRDYYESLPGGGDRSRMTNGKILKTTDGGKTWEVQKESAAEGYQSVFFIDENHGWMVGETYNSQGDTLAIYHTPNGGAAWEDITSAFPPVPVFKSWMPQGVKFATPQVGFAYGAIQKLIAYAPAFFYTGDGGATWTLDTSVASDEAGQMDLIWANQYTAYSVGMYLDVMRYKTGNHAPIANAGADFSAPVGKQARLNGSSSSDPDGDPLTYAWAQTAGPAVQLSNPKTMMPTFTPAETGALKFQLIVNDGELNSAPDSVTVSVDDAAADDDSADDDSADDDAADDDASPVVTHTSNEHGCGC